MLTTRNLRFAVGIAACFALLTADAAVLTWNPAESGSGPSDGSVAFSSSLVVGQFTAGVGLGGAVILDSGALTSQPGNLIVGRTSGDVSSVTINDGSLTVGQGLFGVTTEPAH